MAIDLQGLTVERIIVHHVFKRDENRQPVAPRYGTALVQLPVDALYAFQVRITEALGHRSHGLGMSIANDSQGSFFQQAASAMRSRDDDFIATTGALALELARIQSNKDLSASKLIFIAGRAGASSWPYLAVIKAELQDGFAESNEGFEYLRDLFLTPSQRLYKVGFLHNVVTNPPAGSGMFDPTDYETFLFDHLLTMNETRNAAHYFYSTFLGMEILTSDKRLTQEFFENSRDFINTLQADQEQKVSLFEALRTELRSNRATLQTEQFADSYLDENVRGEYIDYMTSKGVPQAAFSKSLEYIQSRLRRPQQMKFRSGVKLTAPSDQLHQLVTVDEEHADYTIVRINGAIETQE